MKIFFTLLCIAIIGWSFRQAAKPANNPAPRQVNLQTLPGRWIAQDTTQHIIEFRFNDTLKELELHVPGDSRPYHFIRPDKSPDTLRGVRMNWPPYDCYVTQSDSTHITIRYEIMNYSRTAAYRKLMPVARQW